MSVETAGMRHVADLFSGPEELVRQSMAPLGLVVLFVTVVAPLARLAARSMCWSARTTGIRRDTCAGSLPGPSDCARGR